MTLASDNGRIGRVQHQRQQEIYRMAVRDGAVDVAELARHFDVTTETIRRDLSELQARELVRRVHGGAVPAERHRHEPMIDARDSQNAEEKLRIARAAVAQVPDRGAVIIDSGSTGQRFAEVFPVDRNVHVVTNSLGSAMTLARRGIRDLTVVGGGVRTNTLAMVDATVVEAVRRMRADVLFISCDGLSLERGLTTPYREEYTVKRAMFDASRWIVALVDASKFGNEQLFGYADFSEIDVLVTDARASADDIRMIESHGVEVVVA